MILDQVRELVSNQFDVPLEDIREDTRFLEDLSADSLDVVELAVSVEEAFNLPEIDSDELTGIHTVGDLVAYVTRARG